MNTRHLVDPELLPLLETFPTVMLSAEILPAMRNRQLPTPPFDATGTAKEVRSVPGPQGAPPIDLHIYRPEGVTGPLGCIFHVHGGGYIAGSAGELEFIHSPLVRELSCVLVSVEYRLAPETVFPGAIEDCYCGLAWVFANAAALGIDPARIGVMGESAGGGLAAALALLARDRGDYRLAFQHLIYPMLDDRTVTRDDPHPHAGEFLWHAHNNRFGWASLLGGEPGRECVSHYAAAARAKTLEGLPPTFISTGGLDLFLDEDVEYAQRLMRAGVPTELHVYPGAFHAFDIMPGPDVSDRARRDSRAALNRFLA